MGRDQPRPRIPAGTIAQVVNTLRRYISAGSAEIVFQFSADPAAENAVHEALDTGRQRAAA